MNNNLASILATKGELLAAEYLINQGFYIVSKNFRCSFGEIDLIAADENHLIFVEVKTRTHKNLTFALNNITLSKRTKITKAAEYFLSLHPEFSAQECRFDIIIIIYSLQKANYNIHHLANAFNPITSE